MNPDKKLMITEKAAFKILTIFSGSIIFALMFLLFHCENKPQNMTTNSYWFEEIESYDGAYNLVFADFDGDGIEEHVLRDTEKGAVVIDFDDAIPRTACHILGDKKICAIRAFNFIGDAAPEIVFSVKEQDKIWIEVWSVRLVYGKIECKFIVSTQPEQVFDNNNDGIIDAYFLYFQVLDINGDGQVEILGSIETGWDKSPRGIVAYDGHTGAKIWEFPTAGTSYPILCEDVNGDGNKEIIFGTWAPGNGNFSNAMTDSLCYLICLTNDGKLLWKEVMGGLHAATKYVAGDVDDDGEIEILCTYTSGDVESKSTKFQLQKRNGRDGKISKYFPLNVDSEKLYIADLDRDNTSEILCVTTNGFLYVFNSNLEELKKCQLGSILKYFRLHEASDLNQDGNLEIITSAYDVLQIFNTKLELQYKYKADMSIDEIHYFNHPYLGGMVSLLLLDRSGFRKGLLLRIRTDGKPFIPEIPRNINQFSFLFIPFLLGILITILLLKIVPLLRTKQRMFQSRNQAVNRNDLLQTLSAFGHGKTATSNLDRICFLLKNLLQDKLPEPEYRQRIEEAISTYFKFTSHQIQEIIDKSRAATIALKSKENMQTDFEKLKLLLNDFLIKGASQNQLKKYSIDIPLAIESIEEHIEAIKGDLVHYFRCDITKTVREVLTSLSKDFESEEIRFKNLLIEGDIETIGFIGKADLATILENVIRNSIESMKDVSIKELLVKIVAADDKIFLEMTDTGCGIEHENIDKIFDREFSTKTDGGFGLYHARMTLNKYGGKIRVANSKPGAGTTLRLELKRA
jgi:signal transduction histidine kinase